MKLGILSTSRIVTDFLPHLAALPQIELTALCCRPQSAEKGRALCAQYGIGALYSDYADFLQNGDFDFVYVATANHLHYSSALQALQAGRNVILEKPFTTTAAQCDALQGLAAEKGLWLFEAITTLHTPGFAFLQRWLPQIGPVHSVIANYSQYSSRYDDYLARRWNTTFDPACLGGALNDLNVYNLHLVLGLFGAPQGGRYYPTRGYNGVDVDGLAVLQYPGFTASLTACKNGGSLSGCLVQGEKGHLCLRGDPGTMADCTAVVQGRSEKMPVPQRFRMDYEFIRFEEIWRTGDRAEHDRLAARTRAVCAALEQLADSARDGA